MLDANGAEITYHHTKFFLHNLVDSLELKSASFMYDKNGFSLYLVSKDNKVKEVKFGVEDEDLGMNDELLKEVIALVNAQGW